MNQSDRETFRVFYQALAGQSGMVTRDQVDFYTQVLKGNANSRKVWLASKMISDSSLIRSLIVSLGDGAITNDDLAIIAASQLAPVLAPVIQQTANSIWSWRAWPWNWFNGMKKYIGNVK